MVWGPGKIALKFITVQPTEILCVKKRLKSNPRHSIETLSALFKVEVPFAYLGHVFALGNVSSSEIIFLLLST